MEFIVLTAAVSINQDLFSHSNFKDKRLSPWMVKFFNQAFLYNNYLLYMLYFFYSSNNYVLTVYANEIIDEIEGFPPPAPYYIVQVA